MAGCFEDPPIHNAPNDRGYNDRGANDQGGNSRVGNSRSGYRRGGNRGASHRGAFNNIDANNGSYTIVDYEKFGTTKAKEFRTYWLCENIPEGDRYRIIYKDHANPQVIAAPDQAVRLPRRGYPKRHNNREGNDLSVSGNLLEFPLLPETRQIWQRGERPGPVRAIYEEGGQHSSYDVIYHDPTKSGQSLDFTKALER